MLRATFASSSTHRSRSAGADATSRARAACNAVGYGTWAYLGPHEAGHGTWHDRFSCAAAAALHASLHAEEHRCCFGFGWDVPQALKKQVEAWRNGLADDYAKMKKLAPWVDGQSVAYSQGLCSARGSADCLRASLQMHGSLSRRSRRQKPGSTRRDRRCSAAWQRSAFRVLVF
jgi:hypothetical protein